MVAGKSEETSRSYQEILEQEIQQGTRELKRPAAGLLGSGLSAGLDIGFSAFLMAVMLTLVEGEISPVLQRILIANMYSVGFIFVILGRSELYTEHTTLAFLPVLDGRSTLPELGRLWGLVYVSNLVGCTIFAAISAYAGPALGVARAEAFETLASELLGHGWLPMLTSAVLAGCLMGLMSWLVVAARETISQLFVVWLIATSIGLAQLHHVVAGTVEVLAGLFAGDSITLADCARFLFWATLGNTVGGVFFLALIKYAHIKQASDE